MDFRKVEKHAVVDQAQCFSPRHCERQSLPGRSLPQVRSWWMLSTTTRLLFTSDTVSSEHPRIRSGFTAV